MLYLGIDQHRKQLTVSIRSEAGDVVLRRQVSTRWDRVRAFFEEVRQQAEAEGGFAAIVEVCGFNNWLLTMLSEHGCRETVLIQAEKRSKKKTDRRDAHQLSGVLWVNRGRLLAGQRVEGVRRVQPPTECDAEDRQLTAVRPTAVWHWPRGSARSPSKAAPWRDSSLVRWSCTSCDGTRG